MRDIMLLRTALLLPLVTAQALSLSPKVADVSGYQRFQSYNRSALYQVKANGSDYDFAPFLLHLVGGRYEIGYSYGRLLAREIHGAYETLLGSLIGEKWYDKILTEALGLALDWQWDDYLSVQVPDVYKEELKGVAQGALDAGCKECGRYITRGITLSNAPGDLKDFVYILLREFNRSDASWLRPRPPKDPARNMHCSMFAAWGSRTQDAKLFSARNLDWNEDTGINKFKLVMVTVPDDGAIPSVSVGFVGLYGDLAGMSAEGITVHEANLEEDEITFNGFPFVLRLRYIMEYASNTAKGRELWEQTHNTVGFNHMISSGKDAAAYAAGNKDAVVAYVMETMYNYTAFFTDNDPREANATYSPKNSDVAVQIGFPMKEALWRTNHGYDPVIRKHFEWSQAPDSWTMERYLFIHDALETYEKEGIKIGPIEAINITAIAGDKGAHPYTCEENTDGSNVLSVTYQPQDQIMYAAWERGSGSTWRPATCSTYIKFNMSMWFHTDVF